MTASCSAYGCTNRHHKGTSIHFHRLVEENISLDYLSFQSMKINLKFNHYFELNKCSFPFSRKKMLKAWVRAIRRKNFKPTKSSVICSIHFRETDFIKTIKGWILKGDAVPSVFEKFPTHLQPKPRKERKTRKERRTHSENVSYE